MNENRKQCLNIWKDSRQIPDDERYVQWDEAMTVGWGPPLSRIANAPPSLTLLMPQHNLKNIEEAKEDSAIPTDF